MDKRVFLDTGYLIALELASDQYHERARRHWQQAFPKVECIVTTSYVFDEAVTFFNSRNQHAKAVDIGQRLRTSDLVDLVQVSEPLFAQGWHRLHERPDKRYSLTDCISFVVMEQRGLTTALAFDHHFEQAGFRIAPGNSSAAFS